jgi:TPR repeat protein
LQLLRPLADQGDTKAQFNLGVMYANGLGVPQDYAEAVKWFRKAADQGDAKAQPNLGFMYDNGRGVPQDYTEAAKWWGLAADQGEAKAQNDLGSMYAKGQGVPQSSAEAVKWYRLAADQGYAGAQFNLGFEYYKGQGVRQDYAEAAKWWRLAADQGYADAQFNLGALYANGEGVPHDVVRAHMWFNLAGAQGNANALKYRDLIARKMTPTQISEAQRLARRWKPTNDGPPWQHVPGPEREMGVPRGINPEIDKYWLDNMKSAASASARQNRGVVQLTRKCEPESKRCYAVISFKTGMTIGDKEFKDMQAYIQEVYDLDGKVVERDICTINETFDERICDNVDTMVWTTEKKNSEGNWVKIE